MPDDSICRQILKTRKEAYFNNPNKGISNTHSSPTYELLNTCSEFGILDMCYNMIENGCHFGKTEWS